MLQYCNTSCNRKALLALKKLQLTYKKSSCNAHFIYFINACHFTNDDSIIAPPAGRLHTQARTPANVCWEAHDVIPRLLTSEANVDQRRQVSEWFRGRWFPLLMQQMLHCCTDVCEDTYFFAVTSLMDVTPGRMFNFFKKRSCCYEVWASSLLPYQQW